MKSIDSETILVSSNKYIILSYKPFMKAEAILIHKGKILTYGSRETLKKINNIMGGEEIKYEHPILPGFIDAHLHIDGLGVQLKSIDLRKTRSIKEIGEKLINNKTSLGEWIIGRGFDHNLFPGKEPPTRADLDRYIGDKPVLVIHRSGHMGVVNTKGLESVMGNPEIVGANTIDYDRGILYEDALMKTYEYIKSTIPALEYIDIYRGAIQHLLKHGVTSASVAGCTGKCLKGLRILERTGELNIRLHIYFYHNTTPLEHVVREAISSLRINSLIRINGLKLFIDGALGTRTALLSKPYSDDPGNRGRQLVETGEFTGIIEKANKYGLQLAVHAIGDAALDIVLDAYSKTWNSTVKFRHRIEHASLIREDQMGLIDELKPVVVVQPHFIITDKWIVDRLGRERARWVYPFKTLYSKTYTAFSTDAPVEPVNPWETVYAAITRGVYEGLVIGELTKNESMDLVSALDAYTRGSAYALFNSEIGCLLPGCYADYIVVDKDPFKIDPRMLPSIRCLETVLGGVRVYSILEG